MMQGIMTGKTSIYGIIGNPVSHSLSPVMQNAAMAAANIDAVYVPFKVSVEELPVAVSGLRSLNICGFNVTIPHKTAIIPLLDELAPSALQAGAVNTVVRVHDRLIGHNTDGDGMIKSLRSDLDCRLDGAHVLLVGAGGAARGALAALCSAGVASISVLNRTLDSAELLIADFFKCFKKVELNAYRLNQIPAPVIARADLLINATSLGMQGEKIAGVALALMPDHAKVYDMVYNPPVTPLLEEARQSGRSALNGLGMLIAQGELAFSLWHGKPPVAGVMLRAVSGL